MRNTMLSVDVVRSILLAQGITDEPTEAAIEVYEEATAQVREDAFGDASYAAAMYGGD